MKIYLFLADKLVSFSLPSDVSGSFSFDENLNEEDKLINVEAREGAWVLYSTEAVQIKSGGGLASSAPIKTNSFYVLTRNGKDYVIYVSDITSNQVALFSFNESINLNIGNGNGANVVYNCPYLANANVTIRFNGGSLVLDNPNNTKVYVNNIALRSNTYNIGVGNQINIFGLSFMFLNGIIVLCYAKNSLTVDANTNLSIFNLTSGENPEEIAVKDRDLYEADSYFSKSPRIRRVIEMKKFNLTEPPRDQASEEMPILMQIGPRLLMGMTSFISFGSAIAGIINGTRTLAQSWYSLLIGFSMLASMFIWPNVTKKYMKRRRAKKMKEIREKYDIYLKEKEKELEEETKHQKEILIENLVTLDECLTMIKNKQFPFWNRRTDQSDFLAVRIGMGNPPLAVEINDPEKGFTIDESDLQRQVNDLKKKYKFINNAPVSYSFYKNMVTAIMGEKSKCNTFVNNVILQLISFYSYEDLKIVVFTDETNEMVWDYVKYLNHNFSNERDFRFFSSTEETSKTLLNYLETEFNRRLSNGAREEADGPYTPYYLIIIDNYTRIRKYDFIRNLTECKGNMGMSVILIENRLSKLPSKCNNFISIGERTSGVLQNAYERQQQLTFYTELKQNVNMMEITKIVSNIPIEFETAGGNAKLPEMISFLEMEKVGKVEQLNIMNRWRMNDSTQTLKAEVGVNPQGDLIYLDLHEKAHGPHGLIAGTTGSGKSEFIITYILSMCINYSPNDVSFILIDYKGGGLAFAFENRTAKKVLPHLAGTITNLDKAEMDRTLVSIDSELHRRQKMFNEARDILGESTMDIYKYQRFYHEGRLKDPIPHLFIVCDEFAELKVQQPEFMDSLISTARIGRSLGVHLILATQKPTGVVTDQIWSNTRFRVCLKVQDASDSKEMLKNSDAAAIKETGRFYLQVGYDELYVLGQSAWTGAKYFPSDKIVKTVDKSINFLNDCGQFIKSIQASNGERKGEAKGEQISGVLDSIIEVSNEAGIKSRKLWLENIPPVILEEEVEKEYDFKPTEFNVEAIIGKYDAPEKQEQGLVKYNYLEQGNTIVYGTSSSERELFLNAILYSTTKNYSPQEVNFYMIDYGSEALRVYQNALHFGGMVFMSDTEKFNNMIKFIGDEIRSRKKLFSSYGGSYQNYIKLSGEKMPLMVVILNNYDAISENVQDAYDIFPNLTRDSERSGIIFIVTGNGVSSVRGKMATNFKNIYSYKLKDDMDYRSIFDTKSKTVPRDIYGRGVLNNGDLHEFQTVSIIENTDKLPDYLMGYVDSLKEKWKGTMSKKMPELPDVVSLNFIKNYIRDIDSIPVGVNKENLEIYNYPFTSLVGTIVSANKIEFAKSFMKSLCIAFRFVKNSNLIIFDPGKGLDLNKKIFSNYYIDINEKLVRDMTAYINDLRSKKSNQNGVIVIYDFSRFMKDVSYEAMSGLIDAIKNYEKIPIVICDTAKKLKMYNFEVWFNTTFSLSDGIWIGNGVSEQGFFKFSNFSRELTLKVDKDVGYIVSDSYVSPVKFINFVTKEGGTNGKQDTN